jgi:hypothetical protein
MTIGYLKESASTGGESEASRRQANVKWIRGWDKRKECLNADQGSVWML